MERKYNPSDTVDFLYYVAARPAMDMIIKNGIYTPKKVNELIDLGELSRDVLGVSYGLDASNFKNYVSLLKDPSVMEQVAEQICYSRFHSYNHPDFMAIGFMIDASHMNDDSRFISESIVKTMHDDSYRTEVLWKGTIDPQYLHRPFAVRTWKI